ncbi:MAG: ABC transporter permease, partial [Deltaproteobacteria bacterium]|nr:ABC transporter permease [Deltaproteobacteria bacterium]
MSILRETVRQSLKLVVRQPGRSALTMLGLAIGVGAFIAMVSFGEGARRSVLAQFEVLGANLLKVQVRVSRTEAGTPPPAIGDTEVSLLAREAV